MKLHSTLIRNHHVQLFKATGSVPHSKQMHFPVTSSNHPCCPAGHVNPVHPTLPSTVTGPSPGIHSHSQYPLVTLYTGCCSAMQKISLQTPTSCLDSTGPRPGIHSHSQYPDVALKTGCCSAMQKIPVQLPAAAEGRGRVLSFTGSRPEIHSHPHSLLVVLNTGCISEIQTVSRHVGSRPGIH